MRIHCAFVQVKSPVHYMWMKFYKSEPHTAETVCAQSDFNGGEKTPNEIRKYMYCCRLLCVTCRSPAKSATGLFFFFQILQEYSQICTKICTIRCGCDLQTSVRKSSAENPPQVDSPEPYHGGLSPANRTKDAGKVLIFLR